MMGLESWPIPLFAQRSRLWFSQSTHWQTTVVRYEQRSAVDGVNRDHLTLFSYSRTVFMCGTPADLW